MPYSNLLVHAVWATKERKPILSKPNKDALCKHIRENALSKGIYLLNINGYMDHLHGFISLSTSQNVETVLNLIKGESSFWAARNLDWPEKFGWQDEYFAVSVSQSHFERINNYIDRQEIHHRKKTFAEEYEEFMKAYRFKR
jgi:REP element-mobilizing transposase RayT